MSIFKKSATLKSNLMFLMFRDGNTMSIFKKIWPLYLTCFWCSGTGIWCPDQAQWWWVEELVAICQWAGCPSNISLLQEIFHSLAWLLVKINIFSRPTSRTGSRPSSGAGGRGPGEGASGVGVHFSSSQLWQIPAGLGSEAKETSRILWKKTSQVPRLPPLNKQFSMSLPSMVQVELRIYWDLRETRVYDAFCRSMLIQEMWRWTSWKKWSPNIRISSMTSPTTTNKRLVGRFLIILGLFHNDYRYSGEQNHWQRDGQGLCVSESYH